MSSCHFFSDQSSSHFAAGPWCPCSSPPTWWTSAVQSFHSRSSSSTSWSREVFSCTRFHDDSKAIQQLLHLRVSSCCTFHSSPGCSTSFHPNCHVGTLPQRVHAGGRAFAPLVPDFAASTRRTLVALVPFLSMGVVLLMPRRLALPTALGVVRQVHLCVSCLPFSLPPIDGLSPHEVTTPQAVAALLVARGGICVLHVLIVAMFHFFPPRHSAISFNVSQVYRSTPCADLHLVAGVLAHVLSPSSRSRNVRDSSATCPGIWQDASCPIASRRPGSSTARSSPL